MSTWDSAGKQAGWDLPGDHDHGQADAQPAHVATDISPQECSDKSKTACRGQTQRHRKNTLPVRMSRAWSTHVATLLIWWRKQPLAGAPDNPEIKFAAQN